MYHLELRQFPHNLCRFNLSEEELQASVVQPWARERPVELEGRRWNPERARLTIVEGPRIPTEQLTMGRGWSIAQRHGEDVTARVLAAAKAPQGAAPETSPEDGAPDAGLLADSLGLELLVQLERGAAPISQAWHLAAARCPERSAGECLSLADRAVRSLLRSRLIVLVQIEAGGGGEAGDAGVEVGEGEVDSVLRAIDSWAARGAGRGIAMRRA
jgi:hypothetical protein